MRQIGEPGDGNCDDNRSGAPDNEHVQHDGEAPPRCFRPAKVCATLPTPRTAGGRSRAYRPSHSTPRSPATQASQSAIR